MQKKLTTERLVAAIRIVTQDERMKRLAEDLGERIRTENGVAWAVKIINEPQSTS